MQERRKQSHYLRRYAQVFQSVKSTAAAFDEAKGQPDCPEIWKDSSLQPFFSRAFAALAAADSALTDLEAQIVAVKSLLLQFCKWVANSCIILSAFVYLLQISRYFGESAKGFALHEFFKNLWSLISVFKQVRKWRVWTGLRCQKCT